VHTDKRGGGRRARPASGGPGRRCEGGLALYDEPIQSPHVGMEALSAVEYCHLAEECFFLAAVAKVREVAAQLLKAGDDYLQAAGTLNDLVAKRSKP